MKNSNENPQDDFLLTFSDVLAVIKKHKQMIINGSLVCAFIALAFALTRPIKYQVDATFKEKGRSQSGLPQSLSSLFLNAENNDSDALMMMKSRKLIEQLVRSSGLQAVIKRHEPIFPLLPLQTIKQNLLVEYALYRKMNAPILSDNTIDISASHVAYNSETPLELKITCPSNEEFEIINTHGDIIAQGIWGIPVSTSSFEVTLNKKNLGPILSKSYRLTLLPLGKTIHAVANKFTIESDRSDKSLLKIVYNHGDRHEAAAHVVALMKLYQEHALNEHQRTCALQIDYLQSRQLEMDKQLAEIMKNHTLSLISDLSDTGFANYDIAMNFLTTSQQNYKQKLQNITLEMQWLNQAQKEGKENYDKFTSSINPETINLLSKDIRLLRHEAGSLAIALKKTQPATSEETTNKPNVAPIEFRGMDLLTVKELYINYSKELNDLESKAAQQQFIISQINDPEFEISSLSTVLNDPISNEMISKASQLIVALKDHENRSQKEQDRIKAGLSLHKSFFITHLSQTVQLIELRQRLMKEKIESLQAANLSLIKDQIFLLENQMDEYISKRLMSLERERELFEKNLVELKTEMASLAHKRVAEQLIEQQMEINQNMVEEISKLVESKNLTSNLEKIQSAPIDLPQVPIHPKHPNILLFTLLGALAGAFIGFCGALIKSVTKGVAASPENLHLAGQHVSGLLSNRLSSTSSAIPLLDSDLNTLRRLIAFMLSADKPLEHKSSIEAKSLLILSSNSPNYTPNLAELMSKMGFKILIMSLCFDKPEEGCNNPGMLPFLEGRAKEPFIAHTSSYDMISAGGITRYSHELLGSDRFDNLMHRLKKEYDWILVSSNAPISGAEAECLLNRFPNAAITVGDESLQQLRHCILSAKNAHGHLSFIFTDR